MPINYNRAKDWRRLHQYAQAQAAIENALQQMRRVVANLPTGDSRNLATEANVLLLTLQDKCWLEVGTLWLATSSVEVETYMLSYTSRDGARAHTVTHAEPHA